MTIYRVLGNGKETFFKNYDKAYEYAQKIVNNSFPDNLSIKASCFEALELYDNCRCARIDDFLIDCANDNLDTVYVLSDLSFDFNFTSVYADKKSALEAAEQYLENHHMWGLNPEDEEQAYRHDMWLLSTCGFTTSGTFELNEVKLTD